MGKEVALQSSVLDKSRFITLDFEEGLRAFDLCLKTSRFLTRKQTILPTIGLE